MKEPFNWNEKSLPKWAQSAVSSFLEPPPTSPTSRDFSRDEPGWPLLVDAAVVSNFLPKDLAPENRPGPERSVAESSVLGLAETTYDPAGVKWSLNAEQRVAVLNQAIRTGDLESSLKRTENRFTDPVSRALRSCLTGVTSVSDSTLLSELEATRTAVNLLSGVPGLVLPDVRKLEREIELKRLLAPLERMIGQEAGGISTTHQFFGREKELKQLRDYVGEIPSTSFVESAGRAINWVRRAIKGRAPLAVWGVGGAGKTTLISKFVLEHAKAATSRYPFVYLDFDRPTVSARNRVGLLGEMCTQVGAQFEALSEPMTNLSEKVSEFATGSAEVDIRDSISRLFPYIQDFRRIIDNFLQSSESTLEFARPFLVVMDTFEIVQYDHEDVVALEQFLNALVFGAERTGWARMRLIISGRKQVSKFGDWSTENLTLGALDKKGSGEMLTAMAARAGKPISSKDSQRLVAAIAKVTGESSGGVQPLRLRLIGDIFEKATSDGTALVQSLINEFQNPVSSGGMAGQILIDGILVRRIIGHIGDERVRALADPGLVVRRITRSVIQNVMTRGTAKPAGVPESPETLDAEIVAPWIVDDGEAKSIFEAFKREVSLVEVEGDVLRHRQDVRQEMLPLIKARRPKRFVALHRLAHEYFLSQVNNNPSDRASAAEAVYHGLHLGVALSELNQLWPEDSSFDPRIDAEEFASGSKENIFVRAKTHGPLEESEIGLLPSGVAVAWVAGTLPKLLGQQKFDDRDISLVRTAAGQRFEDLRERPESVAILVRLLYRSGLWDESAGLARQYDSTERRVPANSNSDLLSMFRTHLTIASKSVGRGDDGLIDDFRRPVDVEPLAAAEIYAHSYLCSIREYGEKNGILLSSLETALARVPRRRWNRELKLLRLVILCGPENVRELLKLYLQSTDWAPRDRELWIGEEPDWVRTADVVDQFRRLRSEVLESRGGKNRESLNSFWKLTQERLARAVESHDVPIKDVVRLIVFNHSDWVRCMGNALTRAFRDERLGDSLLKTIVDSRIVGQDYAGSLGRRTITREDGLELVRSLFDDGRLLEFAGTIQGWKNVGVGGRTLAYDESRSYPQDVFALAEVLLKWHQSLLDLPSVKGPNRPPSKSAAA